ncbi:MAG: sulfate ABC transporter ATP-binding protein, partial [Pseudomonas sp.]|nr:sulfate ABC transporter ATP-binding protein [Pseudomonas sp.]
MSILVNNIRKQFGNFTALDDVSLEFPSGELVALLGPSGCGKTTLLRIIAGLESADGGQVLLNGEDAATRDVRERQVGFVFQHYALFRHMTVFENIAFGLRVRPRKTRPSEAEIGRRVHELLELVQLDWLAKRYPAELSGGQRQRIALARALAVEPQVLLLDEPFGALDAQVRKDLRRWLRRLHDELHITSIFVTHDQEEALEVADRVVLMNRGRVEQIGTPNAVYEQPASPFVYGFLGSVNLFHGRVRGDHLEVESGAHLLELDAHTEQPLLPDSAAVAYARPHEIDVIVPSADAHDQIQAGIPAIVRRILAFGGSVRVELEREVADGTSGAVL